MAVERQLSIPGLLEKIPEACDFVVQAAESVGLDERAVYFCQMAVDEWCTNIVEHGFGGSDESRRIEIDCRGLRDSFTITIKDDGPRFDPTAVAQEEPSKALEEREAGGLGLFFIRKIMDEVHYEYKNGRNNLTMVKHIPAPAERPARSGEPVYPSKLFAANIGLVMPSGRLDSVNSPMLELTLAQQIAAAHMRLIVDMSGVTYISSSGLRVLVSTWRKTQKAGGNLLLLGLTPRVLKVFEMSGFDTLFTIVGSVDEAVLALNSLAKKS